MIFGSSPIGIAINIAVMGSILMMLGEINPCEQITGRTKEELIKSVGPGLHILMTWKKKWKISKAASDEIKVMQ